MINYCFENSTFSILWFIFSTVGQLFPSSPCIRFHKIHRLTKQHQNIAGEFGVVYCVTLYLTIPSRTIQP